MSPEQMPYRPQKLIKRDGSEVSFDIDKIERAIEAAGQATRQFGAYEAKALADAVLSRLLDFQCLAVEQVQEKVELILMEAGYYTTASAYIVHRERNARQRPLP